MQALEHRQQLDGLRFFSFLAVFMIHTDVEKFWWGSYEVSLFFVISGFLITRILIASQDRPRRAALKAFYVRRALRIFPPTTWCWEWRQSRSASPTCGPTFST